MGTEKPVVFPKQVMRVRVQCVTLAYRGIPHTRTRSYGYFTGILQQGEHNFYCFKTHFFLFLIIFFFILSHCDATKYGSASHAYIFASYHQALTSQPHSHPTSK
jgi:hypothetical protein